jgi:hypothetical protein
MSKCQGKGVKQTVKDFLAGVRKRVHPHEDEGLFAESSSSGIDRVSY